MTTRIRLAEVAQARSGDKGDLANVALFAPTQSLYGAFLREVTAERVRALFGRFVKGDVDRHEVPNVRALNFVLHQALDGGAARSLRSDPLGKSYGSLLLRMEIDVTDEELSSARPTGAGSGTEGARGAGPPRFEPRFISGGNSGGAPPSARSLPVPHDGDGRSRRP